MEKQYIDLQGIAHDLQVSESTYNGQKYYRIIRDGSYFMDITRREDGSWEELFNGPSQRADEYGELLAKTEEV